MASKRNQKINYQLLYLAVLGGIILLGIPSTSGITDCVITYSKSKIIFSPNRSGDRMLEVVAHKKKILTNSISFHQLEDGLSKTIDYYKKKC